MGLFSHSQIATERRTRQRRCGHLHPELANPWQERTTFEFLVPRKMTVRSWSYCCCCCCCSLLPSLTDGRAFGRSLAQAGRQTDGIVHEDDENTKTKLAVKNRHAFGATNVRTPCEFSERLEIFEFQAFGEDRILNKWGKFSTNVQLTNSFNHFLSSKFF